MADEEPEAGGGGVRKTCTLQPATVAYLEKLVKVGTHGGTIPGVMTRLIEEGVRQALRDGFIKKPEES